MSLLRYLPTKDIRFRSDARPREDTAIEALADSIAQVGLINPIRVRQIGDEYEVIAGAHRLTAVILNGEREVMCVVVDDDDLHAELAMIDENLCRAELKGVLRDQQTARRKAIYEALHPETRNGVIGATARHAPAKLADASFTAETASLTGQSERTIQRSAERGEKIAPEAANMIAGTRLDTGAYADKIKALPAGEQAARVAADLATPASRKAAKAPKKALVIPVDDSPVARLLAALDGFDGITSSAVLSDLQPRDRARLCQRVSSAIDLLFEIQEGAQQ